MRSIHKVEERQKVVFYRYVGLQIILSIFNGEPFFLLSIIGSWENNETKKWFVDGIELFLATPSPFP